ncbi:MAG: hypothetical protein ACYDEJ_15410 [Desulfitobacteriaceae bacterium]
MSERLNDIEPISAIQPTRRIMLKNPKQGNQEQKYQSKRYHKSPLCNSNKKSRNVEKELSNSSDKDLTDIKVDLHNRNAYDRMTTLGQYGTSK